MYLQDHFDNTDMKPVLVPAKGCTSYWPPTQTPGREKKVDPDKKMRVRVVECPEISPPFPYRWVWVSEGCASYCPPPTQGIEMRKWILTNDLFIFTWIFPKFSKYCSWIFSTQPSSLNGPWICHTKHIKVPLILSTQTQPIIWPWVYLRIFPWT